MTTSSLLDKLDGIIREKQIELMALQADMNDALTGIDSPDYQRAGRLQPLIHRARLEIERLEGLRKVKPAPQDFPSYFSRLLTDDKVTGMELWSHISYHEGDMTMRIMEIYKLKSSHTIGCRLHLTGPAERYVYIDMIRKLQRLGWTAGRGGKIFWFKTRVKNPNEFDTFCQLMAATMIEALDGIGRQKQQYYRYR